MIRGPIDAPKQYCKETLEALFKTLLHHLVTGKLRVEAQPNER